MPQYGLEVAGFLDLRKKLILTAKLLILENNDLQEGAFSEDRILVIDISLSIPFSSTDNNDLISCNNVWVACQRVPRIPRGG
jgi:hypothetical protein